MFKWIKRNLSPKRKITAIVVAVVDALSEQYDIVLKLEEGGIRVSFVEKPAEWDDVDEVAE